MKVLFVEPPKEFWFVMGEYLPPPLGILELASYLEEKAEDVEIEVLDCQAEQFSWQDLENHIERLTPDIVAPSALATCNSYAVANTVGIAKKVNPQTTTVVGGQHFTATADESLAAYPEIDIIVRGEGEQTFAELVREFGQHKKPALHKIKGISFKQGDRIFHNPPRAFIKDLDDLPFPGYHLVREHMDKYHFTMMAGSKNYALIEGSRGCPHKCTFCSQWKYWNGQWRSKSAKRIADEFEYCYNEYGSKFLWLVDDNFGLGKHVDDLCDEILKRGIADDILWFVQARIDDVIQHQNVLSKMHKAGNQWMLIGAESGNIATLETFNKKIRPSDVKQAVELLRKSDIFAQATFIIGERKDSAQTIHHLREFANHVDPDLAIFMILTPFPGTDLYEEARQNQWIEDSNFANYDMTHAIMPTENLSRKQLQQELYKCYSSFYGSVGRRLKGLLAPNKMKRRTYRYLAGQGLLKTLASLF
ncbi:MAG: cobalamin-dependent protein [Candidatus Bathyarchaeota archaeon]|nr:MAG: cobalamin-dependent protein [Candidatus Bathyarchaeota archaeon]